MKLTDTKIGTRLLASYILLAIISGVVGIFGIVNLKKSDEADTRLFEKMTVPIADLADMETAFQRIRVNVRDYIYSTNENDRKKYHDRMYELKAQFDETAKKYESTLLTDEDKKLTAQLVGDMEKYMLIIPQIDKFLVAGDVPSAVAIMRGELQDANVAVQASLDNNVHLKLKLAHDTNEGNTEMTNTSISVMFGIILIAIALAILFGIMVARSITIGVGKGVGFAELISQGDLTIEVEPAFLARKDEIGALARAMDTMKTKLKEVISNVLVGSENILSASLQMSNTSQEMSQGATEQASSAEEVSASMEEMAANIQQNTDNAQGAEKISIQGADKIRKSNEAAQMSIVSMREIADKVSIISDIAFQTNILALNAAVEAARAGEQGRGFAVVAAEVRKLAERSKVAAEEISRISTNGVKISDEAGRMLEQVVPEIQKTAKLVQEIAAASIEQNSGADQVNSALQQLNQVTQQNAAASEEMATASEELASQAEQLKEIISYFRIDSNSKNRQQATVKQYASAKATAAYTQKATAVKASAYSATKVNNFPKTTGVKSSKGVSFKMNESGSDNGYEKF